MAAEKGKQRLWLVGGVPDNNGDGIGANCQVFEYENNGETHRVMIDCGIKLPRPRKNPETGEVIENSPYDAIIPDFRMFLDGKDGQKAEYPIDAVCVTHAHADHLDGLIFMTLYAHQNKLKMPKIMCREYTKEQLISMLKQYHLPAEAMPDIKVLKPYDKEKVADINIESFPVRHSTIDSSGFYLSVDNETGYKNPGDNRELPSHTELDELSDGAKFHKWLSEKVVTLMAVDSTSAMPKEKDEKEEVITFHDATKSIERIFQENPGKRFFTPLISRSVENWLPFMEVARHDGKKIYIDGYQQRNVFRNWQKRDKYCYFDKDGNVCEINDKKSFKKLREKNINIFSAEDYRSTVWNADDVMHPNVEHYKKSIGKSEQLIFISGAFAEATDDQVSGCVKLAQGTHLDFQSDKDAVFIFAQRIIEDVNCMKVIEMVRSILRTGATVYLNELSRPVLQKVGAVDLLKTCKFAKLQSSGHRSGASTNDKVHEVTKYCKNSKKIIGSKEFEKMQATGHSDEKGYKLQLLALHGNLSQCEGALISASQNNPSVDIHQVVNGQVIEHGAGYVKFVEPREVRFLGKIKSNDSGQMVLKSLDKDYQPTDREDEVINGLSSSPERSMTRQDNMIENAQKLEEQTPARQTYAQKHRGGKCKQNSPKKENTQKLSRKEKKRHQQEQRCAARFFKDGYSR